MRHVSPPCSFACVGLARSRTHAPRKARRCWPALHPGATGTRTPSGARVWHRDVEGRPSTSQIRSGGRLEGSWRRAYMCTPGKGPTNSPGPGRSAPSTPTNADTTLSTLRAFQLLHAQIVGGAQPAQISAIVGVAPKDLPAELIPALVLGAWWRGLKRARQPGGKARSRRLARRLEC